MNLILFFTIAMAHAQLFPGRGTPKTLNQAVQNGVERSIELYGEVLAVEIERHVTDFIAQKISIMSMKHQGSDEVLLKTYELIRKPPACAVLGVVE